MSKEKWVPVRNWECYYEISSHSKVRRKDRIVDGKNGSKRFLKGIVLSLSTNSDGYLIVLMSAKGVKRESISLHRLLAIHFIPNPLGLPEVNHKDTNKINNKLSNLEWVTKQRNIEHAKENGLYKNNWKNSVKAIEKQKIKIIQYDLVWNFIQEWDSIRAAARGIKCSHSQIQFCLKGKKGISQVHGYRFKYK